MEGLLLSGYVALALGLAVVGYIGRQLLLRGPDGLDADTLTGEEVGFLLGGHERATAAALARLRATGSIRIIRGVRIASGNGPPQEGRIAGQILRVVEQPATSAGVDLRAVYDHSRVRGAVRDVRERLLGHGWLIDRPARWRIAACGVPLVLLASAGFLAAAVSVASDRPAGDSLAGAVGALVGGLYLTFRVPDRYDRVEVELDRLRAARDNLRPENTPALVTYGPHVAALAVGLFGTSVLLGLEPKLAVSARAPDPAKSKDRCGSGGGCGGCSGGGGTCGGGCGGCGG